MLTPKEEQRIRDMSTKDMLPLVDEYVERDYALTEFERGVVKEISRRAKDKDA